MNKPIFLLLLSLMLFSCTEKKYSFEFIERNTPGNSSLRAICAVDENTVWVSGSQGQVQMTTDGGVKWREMRVPGCEETEFRSLHAWDALRAIVFDVSPEGRAFMTTDGGVNWELVYRSPVDGAFFNSLKFADEEKGIAISDPIDDKVFILRTDDGGWNWERLEDTPVAQVGEINFAASNTCVEYLPSGEIYIVTGGSRARILSSKDHGKNWEFYDTPMMTGSSAGLFTVNFQDSESGVAMGGDFNDPARKGIRSIYTEDGGLNWYGAESMPAAYRSCVVSLKDDLLFATGKTGCDYSVDGGKHWSFIDSSGYYAASTVKGRYALFLSGSEGRVAKVIVHSSR